MTLVLTRKPGEAVLIGDGITVRVVTIKGGQVQIGIDAPRELGIWREEIAPENTDCGICPNCESAAIKDRGDSRFACRDCHTTWLGARRRLAA